MRPHRQVRQARKAQKALEARVLKVRSLQVQEEISKTPKSQAPKLLGFRSSRAPQDFAGFTHTNFRIHFSGTDKPAIEKNREKRLKRIYPNEDKDHTVKPLGMGTQCKPHNAWRVGKLNK